MAAAGAAYRRLLPALRQPGPRRTRGSLYRVYVVPALIYGVAEIYALSQEEFAMLSSAHNDYLRRITGMWRRADGTYYPLRDLYRATGVPSLLNILHTARLTRLGHVGRMPNTSVVKQLLFATGLVGEDVQRGRPRRTWLSVALDSVAWADKHARVGWYAKAQDRTAWDALCTVATNKLLD